MRRDFFLCALIGLTLSGGLPTYAQPLEGDAVSGRRVAVAICGPCHMAIPSMSPSEQSPPRFNSIAKLSSTTALSLKVFLRTNHNEMPNLILSQADTDNVIAYILSLKEK